MINTDKLNNQEKTFYRESLQLIKEHDINFLLGGAFAFFYYTGMNRFTKDLDIFCKPSDCTQILNIFRREGYETEFTDARWIGKIRKGDLFIDIIFDSPSSTCTVDETWFYHAPDSEFEGCPVKLIAAEELIWTKIYVQNRDRYDGADINHVLLKYGKKLDWDHLLFRLDRHWHLLLSQFLNFMFVYPSEYQRIIPRSLFDSLLDRAQLQYEVPSSIDRICRGPLLDQVQYSKDIKEWNFKILTMKTI